MLITANRFVLTAYGSIDVVGVFSIYMTVAILGFRVLVEPIVIYFHPVFFRIYDESKEKFEDIFSSVASIVMFMGVFLALCLIKYQELIISFISNREYVVYDSAFVVCIVLGGYMSSLYRIFSTVYYLKKDTSKLAYIVAGALMIMLTLSFGLTQKYFLLGAAISYLGAQFFMAGLLLIQCYSQLGFRLNRKMLLALVIAIAASASLGAFFVSPHIYILMLIDSIIAGLLFYTLVSVLPSGLVSQYLTRRANQ